MTPPTRGWRLLAALSVLSAVACGDRVAPRPPTVLAVESAPLGDLPQVRLLAPAEARQGTRLRLEAQGSALDGVTAARLRHREHPSVLLPIRGPLPSGHAGRRVFDVHVPAGAAPGAYEFAVTIDGVVVLSSVPFLVRAAGSAEPWQP
jgi:hypothetical protein